MNKNDKMAIASKIIVFLGSCFVTGMAAASVESTTSYTYNSMGLIETIDGPRTDVSDITSFTYDEHGNRIGITNALNQTTQITAYNTSGKPLTIVDPNGVTTQLTYDARGRLLTKITGGQTTSMEYDGVGNITGITQPDGSRIEYQYDAANRLIGITDTLGNSIQYTLDAAGNKIKEEVFDHSEMLTRSSTSVYDELSRLRQVIDSGNQVSVNNYDPNGNLTSQTDPRLNATSHEYDALNRLQTTTDAANGITQYTYDNQGNLAGVTDPRGLTTTYTHDGLGNLVNQSSPDTGVSSYTYDEAGNRLSVTDARGITATYSYDVLNRVTRIAYSDGSPDVAYTYDQGANGIGRLSGIQDRSGTISYKYDVHGNVVEKSSADLTTKYEYDDSNRLVEITYPSGLIVRYQRNGGGQIEGVTAEKDGTTTSLIQNVVYAPFGQAKGWDIGNGIQSSFDLDLDYKTSHISIGQVIESNYSYDGSGNIAEISDELDNTYSKLYSYDQLNRLITADGGNADLTYGYDPVGNRLEQTEEGAESKSYIYAAQSNRLTQENSNTTVNYTHDAHGNLTSDGNHSYQYDATGRLVSVDAGNTAIYKYNALGQRVYKQADISPENEALALEYTQAALTHRNTALNLLAEAEQRETYAQELFERYDIAGRRAVVSQKTEEANAVLLEVDALLVESSELSATADAKTEEADIYEQEAINLQNQLDDLNAQFPSSPIKVGAITVFIKASASDLMQQIADTSAALDLANQQAEDLNAESASLSGQASDLTAEAGVKQAYAESLLAEADAMTQQIDADEPFAAEKIQEAEQLMAEALALRTQGASEQEQANSFAALANDIQTLRNFIYDESGKLLGAYDVIGSPQHEIIYMDNIPVALVLGNIIYNIHVDHLNTPRAITDGNGVVVWRWRSKPFGDSAPDEDPDGDGIKVTLNLRFPGQYYDQETGLYYNYYRYYDPSTGRYITSDPIGLEGGLNTYAYVGGNPFRYFDIYGLEVWSRNSFPDMPSAYDSPSFNFGVCGSKWYERLAVPDSWGGANFSNACKNHDKCYECGGKNKQACDKDLEKDIQKACNDKFPIGSWNNLKCHSIARKFYNAVNTKGQAAFNRARQNCSDCKDKK